MTENQELKSMAAMLANEETEAWLEAHLPELKQDASGQRLLYQSLEVSIVVGLAAHVGGYWLQSSVPAGLLGLLADLLHALGWSLWTGAVVAVFIQIAPEAKRRQIQQFVEAYEALRQQKAQASGARPEGGAAERRQEPTRARNRARKSG